MTVCFFQALQVEKFIDKIPHGYIQRHMAVEILCELLSVKGNGVVLLDVLDVIMRASYSVSRTS